MADNDDKKPDYLEMNDEDFLKINPPANTQEPQVATPEVTVVAAVETETKTVEENLEKKDDETKVNEDNNDDPATKTDSDKSADPDDASKTKEAEPEKDKDTDAEKAKQDKDKTQPDAAKTTPADNTQKDELKTPVETVGYQRPETLDAALKIVDTIMKPFKANGKEIKLNSPEEAVRMMQMGANYGRKLQDLQPALKTLRMLEKHQLLDENKLSFLIDINNKNPDAIKKLIKESGIDPLDLNTEGEVTYRPVNRSVTDEEMSLQTALDDLKSREGGQETIIEVNTKWDNTSKQALWKSPELLKIIQDQKESGIYDQIVSEIDRQKLLGTLPPNTPFLQAYKTAGDTLVSQNKLAPTGTPSSTPAQTVIQPDKVIETRTAPVKSDVANNDKARAAAPSKAAPRKAASTINPLQMADDDFMKQFEGRI